MRLERVTNGEGVSCQPPSLTQINKHGRTLGNSITANCYICHKYILKQGQTDYMQNVLCKADQSLGMQEMSCYLEHKSSTDPDIGCDMNNIKKGKTFRKEKQNFIGED